MPEQKGNSSYFALSLGLHFFLFILALLSQKLGLGKAEIIQPTIRVDIVSLPNQVKNPEPVPLDVTKPIKEDVPPPPPPPPPVKTEPDTMAAPPPKPVEKTHKAVEKKAKTAIEKIREEMEEQKREEAARKKNLLDKRKADLKKLNETYRSAVRGNQVNQGTSETGQMEETKNAYGAHITDRLRSNWSLPTYLQSHGYRAVVRIYINAAGKVMNYVFMKSSGNEVFDEYVKSTILQSSPFAPPPEEFAGPLRNSGIEVIFPL